MKKLKQLLSLLLTVTLILGTFVLPASAAERTLTREEKAQYLFTLGLFKGYDNTGENFGLADDITREQAIIFLVRLLGEETAATAWTGAQPYDDVPSDNYSYLYVGHAKDKGYTNGIGGNKFGLGLGADMNQMTVFALRGLGYSESAGDFTYQNSVDFAKSKGILESAEAPDAFTRGDAVDILYGAVSANVKNQSATLLDKLVSQGAVTQEQVEKADAAIAAKYVAGVKMSSATARVRVGKTVQLTAEITPATAVDKSLTWTSGAPAIATVDDTGKVTGVKAGTATITVETADGGKTATCKVTVTAASSGTDTGAGSVSVAVTGVSLDKSSDQVLTGEFVQLTGTVAPADATNKSVTWTSSDPTIATVDSTGKVTGIKVGVATITVKTADGDKTATCEVTVYMNKEVKLYNNTRKNVTQLYICSSQESEWGTNHLTEAFNQGDHITVSIPVFPSDYTYDFKLTYNGGSYEFKEFNFADFTSGGSLYAYIDAGTPKLSTTPVVDDYDDKTVNLYNRTDKTITKIFISSKQSEEWGSNLITASVAPGESVAIQIPVSPSDYTYDIRCEYGGISYYEFAAYNFKDFASGGALYAYLNNGTPTLSTTDPGAGNTPAPSAALCDSGN